MCVGGLNSKVNPKDKSSLFFENTFRKVQTLKCVTTAHLKLPRSIQTRLINASRSTPLPRHVFNTSRSVCTHSAPSNRSIAPFKLAMPSASQSPRRSCSASQSASTSPNHQPTVDSFPAAKDSASSGSDACPLEARHRPLLTSPRIRTC